MRKRPLVRREYRLSEKLLLFVRSFTGKVMEQQFPFFKEDGVLDLREEEKPSLSPFPQQMGTEELLKRLKETELRGYGGAGYPVASKLENFLRSLGEEKGILIINAMECDPGLRQDAWLLKENVKELHRIVKFLKNSLPIRDVYLAHSTEAPFFDPEIFHNVQLKGFYPAGEQIALISSLLCKEIPEGVHPSEEGIWVQNLQTILAIGWSLEARAKSRAITFLDLDARSSKIVMVPLGMSAGEVVERVTGESQTFHIGSGVLDACRGIATDTIDERIGLIAIGKVAEFPDERCRGCRQCSVGCPAGIEIARLVKAIPSSERLQKALEGCLECGYCSYICPAGKDLHSLLHESLYRVAEVVD